MDETIRLNMIQLSHISACGTGNEVIMVMYTVNQSCVSLSPKFSYTCLPVILWNLALPKLIQQRGKVL